MKLPLAAGLALVLLPALAPAWVQAPLHQYADADLALGEKLIRDHACSACHARKVGGDGASIYRPQGRINTPGALRGMVDYCSTELNLGLFPDPGGWSGATAASGDRVAVAIYPLAAPGEACGWTIAPGGPEPRLRRCRRARSLDRSRWLTLQYV